MLKPASFRARSISRANSGTMVTMVPELAREIERARIEAGLSIEELLANLREQRERYYTDHYESNQPD